jgi:hypothetical protein
MRRNISLVFIVCILLSLLVLTGIALADLPAQEMPLNPAGIAQEINTDALGNLWVTENSAGELWWVNADGTEAKVYPVGGNPNDATQDNNNHVWWVSENTLNSLDLTSSTYITNSWSVTGSVSLRGTSVDTTGKVWVTDSTGVVYSFNPANSDLCTYPFTDTLTFINYPFISGTDLWFGDSRYINDSFYGGIERLMVDSENRPTWTRWALPEFSQPYDILVDASGDVWYTDTGLGQLGRLNLTYNELSIYPFPEDNYPFMLASAEGKIWFTMETPNMAGSLDPGVAPPIPEVILPATPQITFNCSPVSDPKTGSAEPTTIVPSWDPASYTSLNGENGFIFYQLPGDAIPYGIALTNQGYIVDSHRQMLLRFGFPTSVDLVDFKATSLSHTIQLSWQSAQETDLLGFNLFRADTPDGLKVKLNPEMIPAMNPGQLIGNDYQYLDTLTEPGKTYYYWVEWVGKSGSHLNGPVIGLQALFTWLPSVSR